MEVSLEEEKRESFLNVISDIHEGFENCQGKKSKYVFFDIISSFMIIQTFNSITKNEPAVLAINTDINQSKLVVVGDIHGDLASLLSIFQKEGDPSTTRYLFLGDYVDRGNFSCEVIILLYAYKCLYPSNIYLIRGNHEFAEKNQTSGFKNECKKRVKQFKNGKIQLLDKSFFAKVTDSFKNLPLCSIVNNKIFCVHGGITDLLNNRDELLSIKKVGAEWVKFDNLNTIQIELLWNDPTEKVPSFDTSDRAVGRLFGKEALNDFLNKMGFELVIRGHQSQKNGFSWSFGEKCGLLTIHSTFNCGEDGDEGAIAIIYNDGNVEPIKI